MNVQERKFEEHTKKLFESWAPHYDSKLFRIYFERLYRKIVAVIREHGREKLEAGGTFLDVACGTAEIISRLAPQFPKTKFTGIDLTEAMVEHASQKTISLPNVRITQGRVQQLPFPDASFDFILCSDSFHHFGEPEQALRQIHRVLKPDGIFLLVDPVFNTLVQRLIVHLFGALFEIAYKYYSQKDLAALLEASHFKTKDTFVYSLNNFFINQHTSSKH